MWASSGMCRALVSQIGPVLVLHILFSDSPAPADVAAPHPIDLSRVTEGKS